MRSLILALCAGCGDGSNSVVDAAMPPPPPDADFDPCSAINRERTTVVVSGAVVDYLTAAPIAGVTVDIGTAWDGTAKDCPLLATVTTGADGRFGPVTVKAGSLLSTPIMLFEVRGADRAQTASDQRACPDAQCTVDHTIAAPSASIADAWRSELVAGGMPVAASRKLVHFGFRTPAGDGATGVVPIENRVLQEPPTRILVPGTEVRFLADDPQLLMPSSQATTGISGRALIGVGDRPSIHISGERGSDRWLSTGCLAKDDTIFFEDRRQTP